MRTPYFFTLLFCCYTLLVFSKVTAQPGSIDTTFNPLDPGFKNGNGGMTPQAIIVQPDGKIIAAGQHHFWNEHDTKGIIRLKADGKRDSSFNPGTGVSGGTLSAINSAALQTDGRIIIAGDFEFYNGTSRNRIARLNSNGTLDATFNPGTGADKSIRSVVLQPDGKIIIAGTFTTYKGVARKGIARLNSDGSLDATFNPGTGVTYGTEAWINTACLQADGKIIAGGFFTQYNGTGRTCICRINTDGSIDSTFNPGAGANDEVVTIVLQPDGRILLGGNFTAYYGSGRNRITRINSNGSPDLTFNAGSGAASIVRTISLQPDGKILVGGEFENFNNSGIKGLTRLTANGSIDTGFNLLHGLFNLAYATCLQADGKILASGSYTETISTRGFTRINTDGSFDTTFNRNTGANHIVHALALQSDGKILLGGEFTGFNNIARSRIVRINKDGNIDTSFKPGTGATGSEGFVSTGVYAIAVQTDGKILLGGQFTSYNGGNSKRIIRVNTNGSIDGSFNIGTGTNDVVKAIAMQPDGKILVAGNFININGTGRYYLARLNNNGAVETAFNLNINSSVNSITLQPDGKIIITGSFNKINNINRFSIARLNADGSLDVAFNPGSIVNNVVTNVALQSDGKLVIAGSFTQVNGLACKHLARINADGGFDASFNSGNIGFAYTHLDPYVTGILVQPSGKIIVTGRFLKFNNVNRSCILRLYKNGSLDTGFNPGTGADNGSNYLQSINAAIFQPNGKLLIGGEFHSFNNTGRNRIARVNAYNSYVFTGNGEWIEPTNWLENQVAPTLIGEDIEVFIDPVAGGLCNYPGNIIVESGGRLVIRQGKNLNIGSSLIQQ